MNYSQILEIASCTDPGMVRSHNEDSIASDPANGLVVLTASERAAILRDYLPPVVPRWDGGHLAWLWGRMREQTIFFPWHDRRAATRMDFDVPPADRLQQGLNEFLAAGDHYHVAYAAAFSDAAEQRLPGLRVPLLITAAARDPLAGHLQRIGARSDRVRIVPSADGDAARDQSFRHLAQHPGDHGPAAVDHADSVALDASEYRGVPGRQVRLVRGAPLSSGAGRTVLLLHAPGGSAESVRALAGTLGELATVLVADLPGHGASDPTAAGPGLVGTVEQLSDALRTSLPAAATTIVGIGSSAPAKARVMACSSLSNTSTAKSTPVAAAIARTASWTGLPSTTPQVARGSPIRRALWSSSTVSIPARPGATIFGPPLNPAKKWGSTNPVVIRRSASTHSRAR